MIDEICALYSIWDRSKLNIFVSHPKLTVTPGLEPNEDINNEIVQLISNWTKIHTGCTSEWLRGLSS